MRFEVISKYADAGLNIPVRKTKGSAGYDFEVAEDTIIPSYSKAMHKLIDHAYDTSFTTNLCTLSEIAQLTKEASCKPTLVPTGIKCEIPDGYYLELSVRSSCPLKHWLILANSVGIIDADYYNNPDNEGHIFFQIINLSPFDILLRKGDAIGQGILKKYYLTDNDFTTSIREGGFGSTDDLASVFAEIFNAPKESESSKDTCEESDFLQLALDAFQSEEDECVMACNPNRYPFFVGTRKDIPGIVDEAKTFTTENHDVEYSST